MIDIEQVKKDMSDGVIVCKDTWRQVLAYIDDIHQECESLSRLLSSADTRLAEYEREKK